MAYCQIMAQKSDSRDLDKVIVRLPDGMRDRIKAVAEANKRSMNAEIVATLEEKYPAPSPRPPRAIEIRERLKKAETFEQAQKIVAEANKEFSKSQFPISLEVVGPRKPDGSWHVDITYL